LHKLKIISGGLKIFWRSCRLWSPCGKCRPPNGRTYCDRYSREKRRNKD